MLNPPILIYLIDVLQTETFRGIPVMKFSILLPFNLKKIPKEPVENFA